MADVESVVVSIRDRLKSYLTKDDTSQLPPLLEELQGLFIDAEILRRTKIAFVLQDVRKNGSVSSDLKSLAKGILRQWKAQIAQGDGQTTNQSLEAGASSIAPSPNPSRVQSGSATPEPHKRTPPRKGKSIGPVPDRRKLHLPNGIERETPEDLRTLPTITLKNTEESVANDIKNQGGSGTLEIDGKEYDWHMGVPDVIDGSMGPYVVISP
eukprot:Clim_evm52s156 gene=Clim_evmTU52s156